MCLEAKPLRASGRKKTLGVLRWVDLTGIVFDCPSVDLSLDIIRLRQITFLLGSFRALLDGWSPR